MNKKEQNTKMVTVPSYALSMVTTEGFISRYYINCFFSSTNKEAYYLTESEYYAIFKTNKYSSLNTFQSVLHYHNKKQAKELRKRLAKTQKHDP